MKDTKYIDTIYHRGLLKWLLLPAFLYSASWITWNDGRILTVSASSMPSKLKSAPANIIIYEAENKAASSNTMSSSSSSSSNDIASSTTPLGPPLYGYRSLEELQGRATRFPSVDVRVRYLMSDWYVPPCEGNTEALVVMDWKNASEEDASSPGQRDLWLLELPDASDVEDRRRRQRAFRLKSHVGQGGTTLYVDRHVHLHGCKSQYCPGTSETFFPAMDRVDGNQTSDSNDQAVAPLVVQYGDAETEKAFDLSSGSMKWYPAFPIIKKFRRVFPPGVLQNITAGAQEGCLQGPRKPHFDLHFMPIVAKQTEKRHFGMLGLIADADRPWSQKKNQAIFRGGLHGLSKGNLTKEDMPNWPSDELCLRVPRCRLPYLYRDSKMIDAKLTRSKVPKRIRDKPPLHDWLYADRKMYFDELLEYKALILLEGNDISSGLKWALFSNSVVLIPPPTLTSWALEELLEPWVHYVPMEHDFSDAEEKMQWIIDNDAKAQEIARAGQLRIHDTVYHPDVEKEEEMIFDEMVRRYRKHFVPGSLELGVNVEPADPNEDRFGVAQTP